MNVEFWNERMDLKIKKMKKNDLKYMRDGINGSSSRSYGLIHGGIYDLMKVKILWFKDWKLRLV